MSHRGSSSPLAPFWRRFRVRVGLRLVTIAAAAVGAGVLLASGAALWAAALGAVSAFAAVRLVHVVERPARELTRFLDGVRYDDVSVRFGGGGGGPLWEGLAAAFEDVADAFRRVRAEREEQAAYLEAVVRHVGVALLAFREDGAVNIFNPAAGRTLGVPRPRTLAALEARVPDAAQHLRGLRSGERALIRLTHGASGLQELVAYATQFTVEGRIYTLVSLQDIRAELEARELAAWERLTRVLTHEITNSVAPIASLAGTARALLDEGGDEVDVQVALETIERRSRALVSFVESYRTLAGLPQPDLQTVSVAEVLRGVATLFRTTAAEQGVALSVSVAPPQLDIVVDPDLIEQALVNLVLNAIEATGAQGGGRVDLTAATDADGRAVVRVSDDGPGILPEVVERAFLPFFSTKTGGSGIGLALAHRIARLHGGTLVALANDQGGATLELHL